MLCMFDQSTYVARDRNGGELVTAHVEFSYLPRTTELFHTLTSSLAAAVFDRKTAKVAASYHIRLYMRSSQDKERDGEVGSDPWWS